MKDITVRRIVYHQVTSRDNVPPFAKTENQAHVEGSENRHDPSWHGP